MRVGGEHVVVACALGLVLAVIAVALYHHAERRDILTEIGFARVILKADHDGAAALGRCAVHVVADHALFRADGVHIDRTDEVELHAVPRFVILAEHLVAAADGEKHLLLLNSGADVLALAGGEVAQQHLLLEVLSAADEENVVLVHIERLTDRALVHIDADAAALQTALHRDNVAPVTVQIENVGVKMADIQFHCSFPLIRRTP